MKIHKTYVLAGCFFSLLIILGVLSVNNARERKALRATCLENGYPEYQWVNGEWYCIRRINNSDEVVNVKTLESE